MDFYQRGNAFTKVKPDKYPAICLRIDNWNDFGYYTFFHADYYEDEESITELGGIRILDKSTNRTHLDEFFNELDLQFCSAGSKHYYRTLKDISDDVFYDVMKSLRDCIYSDSILEEFKNEEGFKESINRDGEYNGTKKWFDKWKNNETYDPQDFRLTFFTPVSQQKEGSMEIKLDFRPFNSAEYGSIYQISNRVNLLVGRNGCGKTTAMSKLANYFAKIEGIEGQSIIGCSMMFEKVLVISYSLFDAFSKPFELLSQSDTTDKNLDVRRLNNYIYCGLINKDGIMSIEDMKINVQKACTQIREKNREEFWEQQAGKLLEETLDINVLNLQSIKPKDYENLNLSSGQYFLFSVISELIANIDKNSIVFIDEPEMHLHPNAVSNLLKIIYEILEHYDSYAIMATHSPVILQEVPRKYISHIVRDANKTYTEKVAIETFGSELSAIVDTVFDVDMVHSNYKTVFEELVEFFECRTRRKDIYNAINACFDDKLSFQARMFLKTLISERGGR